MGETTGIEWADHTFNPWIGCTKISVGALGACEHCYAEVATPSLALGVKWGNEPRHRTGEGYWKQPLAWNRKAAAAGTRPFVFCASMADVFDNQVDPAWRRDLFELIHATPHLTWLLLTKRPQNIVKLWRDAVGFDIRDGRPVDKPWPSNAAIGCTVVTQTEADRDVPQLLAAKAALKPAFAFLSMEPLLGPVDLTRLKRFADLPAEFIDALRGTVWTDQSGLPNPDPSWAHPGRPSLTHGFPTGGIDWVITGGETDQRGQRARPSHPDWFRDLRDQCAAAGVPFMFKQWGNWVDHDQPGVDMLGSKDSPMHYWTPSHASVHVSKKAAGRLLDGVEHNARPVVA